MKLNSIEMQSRYDIRIRINLCENVERNFLSNKKNERNSAPQNFEKQ